MKLSVYTLTVNEDEWIAHALSYAATVADEIIVVDGGSTDGTIEVARDFGSTSPVPVAIYRHPMPEAFCDQRNWALDWCTGDWILQLDADERYSTGLKDRLLPTLDTLSEEVVALSLPTWHMADARHVQAGMVDIDPHLRLFRRLPNLRYVRPIHEHLALDGVGLIAHRSHFGELERRVVRYIPDVRLIHYGAMRSDRAFAQWQERWERFAERSIEAGINVHAVARRPAAGAEVPESELPQC